MVDLNADIFESRVANGMKPIYMISNGKRANITFWNKIFTFFNVKIAKLEVF